MHITTKTLNTFDNRYRAQLINSVVGYKSANLIGSQNHLGNRNSNGNDHGALAGPVQRNLAIVSSVCHLGSNPPLLSMIIRPATVPRDTLANIIATGFYTINHVSIEIYTQAHQTAARYPAEVSEFEAVGLAHEYSDNHPAPYVQQSPLKMGMALREIIHLNCNHTEMVIGEIQEIFVDDKAVCEDGYIDMQQLGTVCVTGLDSYHSTQRLARLPYAKP
jgi:flavin reductase (DIM6/NTAB) family NADH-FMN oxidoreductase RutF